MDDYFRNQWILSPEYALNGLLGNLPRESGFKKKMRLHQAWWRAFVLGEEPGFHPIRKEELLGSTIQGGERSGTNFLTENAWKAAQITISERKEYGGGLVEENRLFNNLLSSQPLCFNFFGEMKMDRDLGLKVLQSFFPEITGLKKVIFEYAPEENYLNDNSAYDVAFFVERGAENGLIGLECKYTDTFSGKEYDKEEYRSVFQRSSSFREKYSSYKVSRFNQLFRNQLLAESLVQHQQVDFAYSGLFCHQGDHPALETGRKFSKMLTGDAVFKIITYQDFIEQTQQLNLNWEQREWTMMLWARFVSTRLNCLVDWGGLMSSARDQIKKIKNKLESHGGKAEIPLLRGNRTFTTEIVNGGINVSNLGNQPFLPWKVFEEAVTLLQDEGGKVVRGNPMTSKLSDPGLPLNSLEGHIAHEVYGKKIGDSVFRRSTPVVCILVWADLCRTESGKIKMDSL